MIPVDPDIPELTLVNFGKGQDEYSALPARIDPQGVAITCWELTWKERLKILFGKPIYLLVLTFNSKLQPVIIGISGTVKENVHVANGHGIRKPKQSLSE